MGGSLLIVAAVLLYLLLKRRHPGAESSIVVQQLPPADGLALSKPKTSVSPINTNASTVLSPTAQSNDSSGWPVNELESVMPFCGQYGARNTTPFCVQCGAKRQIDVTRHYELAASTVRSPQELAVKPWKDDQGLKPVE